MLKFKEGAFVAGPSVLLEEVWFIRVVTGVGISGLRGLEV